MQGKKAQTTFALGQLLETLLKIFAFIVLLAFSAGIVSIFTKSRPLDAGYQDFDRAVAEIRDASDGESIKIPMLSNGYSMIIRKTETVEELGLLCSTGKGNYCACLKKNDDMLECSDFELGDAEVISDDEIALERSMGLTLSRQDKTIRLG